MLPLGPQKHNTMPTTAAKPLGVDGLAPSVGPALGPLMPCSLPHTQMCFFPSMPSHWALGAAFQSPLQLSYALALPIEHS